MHMQSFKLKNKEEEQKILDQQIKDTKEKALNQNLSFFQKNPQTMGAIFLGLLASLLYLLGGGIFSLIIVIFAARRLLRATKIGESKKYFYLSYFIVYLPVIFWVLNSFLFAINTIKNAQ